MDYITLLGLLATSITVVAYLPQLIKVWKTRSTRDTSLGTFSIFCITSFLWFIYGVFISAIPLIIANFILLVQGLIIVAFKLKYK